MAFGRGGRRRRLQVLVAVFAVLLGVFAPAGPAHADPDTDDEGGSLNLRQKLEAAATAYYDARAQLTASQKRQAEITVILRESELSLARLSAEVEKIAAARFKGSQLGVL